VTVSPQDASRSLTRRSESSTRCAPTSPERTLLVSLPRGRSQTASLRSLLIRSSYLITSVGAGRTRVRRRSPLHIPAGPFSLATPRASSHAAVKSPTFCRHSRIHDDKVPFRARRSSSADRWHAPTVPACVSQTNAHWGCPVRRQWAPFGTMALVLVSQGRSRSVTGILPYGVVFLLALRLVVRVAVSTLVADIANDRRPVWEGSWSARMSRSME